MMNKRLLDVQNVTKIFTRKRNDYGLKDVILHTFHYFREMHRAKNFIALQNVSFQLNSGESIAVLGANGAGKSTLLSLLAGIIQPSAGSIKTDGKIGLMLELGSGFCHDLSGRENIYLNGLLLGAKKSYLDQEIDSIIDFSGVRDFIDEPLRNYSTGMQSRLGFAIAVHIKPDILLIDEVLAVGDSEFRRKCYDRLQGLKKTDVGIILVTHSLYDALQFCDKAIYLDKGTIRFQGKCSEVIDAIQQNNCEY
jgi:ABC-type polysaccharide/polyol phosphate transport system ATPase subunit